MPDHYETLGVSRDAHADEIRRCYLRLARDRHPDRFTDPAEKAAAHEFFQDATEAYNTLSNEQRRREYDQELLKPRIEKPEDIARDAFERALKMLESRAEQDAVDLLHVAIHHQPQEARYHAELGRLLARHPKHARDAVAALEKAAQLAPETLSHHLALASLLHEQRLRIRAQKALEPALKLAPQNAAVQRLAQHLGLREAPPVERIKTNVPGLRALKSLFGKKN